MDIENLTLEQQGRRDRLQTMKRKIPTKPAPKRVKVETVWKVKHMLAEGNSKGQISRKLNVCNKTIQRIEGGEYDHYPYITRIELFGDDMEVDECRLGGDARTRQH